MKGGRHDDARHRSRTGRSALGADHRPRPGAGRDLPALPRPDRCVGAPQHRQLRRHRPAPLRQLAHRPRPDNDVVGQREPRPHRGLQAVARQPREHLWREAEEDDDQPAPRHAAGDHRTAHRMGPSRRPAAQPDLRHRPAQARRTTAQVPRRRRRGRVHARRHPTRPVPPTGRRDARPHRHARRRALRPAGRRRRAPSARPSGYASPSASCTPTATSRCTRSCSSSSTTGEHGPDPTTAAC